MDKPKLMRPKININGMTRESHIELRMDIRDTLRAAMRAMSEIHPHGRDYLGDNERYEADFKIYCERFSMLDKLYNELGDEALAIKEWA